MNIERKQGFRPIPFMVANPRYYATLADYVPRDVYLSLVLDSAPQSWTASRLGAWWHISQPDAILPNSGFKIHISSDLASVQRVLFDVSDYSFENGIPFKFLVDDVIHEFANSKNYSSWSCGKFITLFPRCITDFMSILPELTSIVGEGKGPYIYSDHNAPGSRSVFYRYGAFSPSTQVNVYGEYERFFSLDGKLFKDGGPNVLESVCLKSVGILGDEKNQPEDHANEADLILKDRYLVLGALHKSNTGAVLKALDTVNDRNVVIKEARAGISTSGILARDLLLAPIPCDGSGAARWRD